MLANSRQTGGLDHVQIEAHRLCAHKDWVSFGRAGLIEFCHSNTTKFMLLFMGCYKYATTNFGDGWLRLKAFIEVCALNFRSVQRLIVRSKEELPLCNSGRLPADSTHSGNGCEVIGKTACCAN